MKQLANHTRFLIYIASILVTLVMAFVLIIVLMRPPLSDLVYLTMFLALTSLGSAIIGYISHRLGWWRRPRSLNLSLTLGYLLAAVLTLLNVWLTARLMFINQHDFLLASILLLFAGGVSVAFGYFLSSSITQSLGELAIGAERLSSGDFSIRVPVRGKDEVAQLAHTFNEMVLRLAHAKKAERDLDAARRNLVAWASHDLRTPLASLRAMLDALADGVVDDPDTVARYLRQCQNEVGRMNTLIDDLFELAQLDAGQRELVCELNSLTDLISDTLESFQVHAREADVKLMGSVADDLDPVWMAPEKIGRVLGNLLDNAIRHTPSGGLVELHAIAAEDHVMVSVADSGVGISAEDLPFVFDRFFRGERSRSREGASSVGAGLGLAIAKGLVEAHGGRIWVERSGDTGTEMRFTLPRMAVDSPG